VLATLVKVSDLSIERLSNRLVNGREVFVKSALPVCDEADSVDGSGFGPGGVGSCATPQPLF
jgi:hypothetical protein